ncbi:sorting nexin-17 isoform X1 [Ceratina calcarata]|uniref:Sorting nexin-17 isoform X1 n=1 Tax=Ceratina calcarata TaxID=156304 RepID=A0AAJ7S4E0_9HYME|nr:sorting nexin-17 isoform X1 [Ceratina calcarata]XP_026671247.1 sorting nexin-17 isoform X1 [Ceratina calcarata]XP_026671248.1 sorting nexin-17 isoform X1 [Ceratina calcarata]XP_026671249.1 sorting nexin-17 isoform X1 [Ceratina calcarata]XP_026671250.1 sorting nexin-17 isoform X1 [Ceratina calcarata]XP_026671251.1 sorting nexin-17 isoform X1 [Ceratina calcarata]XP_026671252.1 sorting nexin-17 isoform X1 [Ceratina calcarata]
MKMHFSIPDTQEFIDASGNAYIGYNIHINGLFHCTVRYKQLYSLHEQLAKDLDIFLPSFPPKRFFPLTTNQQEERRLALEKYIQAIGQNPEINKSGMLNGFLLNAQQETIGGQCNNEVMDIFLMNGCKITINVTTGDHSDNVLKKVYKHIRLPEQYYSYFALFILVQDEANGIRLLRKLQDFESPFITNKHLHIIGSKVMLGKNYWDIGYDLTLMTNAVAVNLLYVQAVAEVEREWIPVPDELKEQLIVLQKEEKKKEYLDIVRTAKYYGFIQFAPCFCDYPQPDSKVLVAIGRNQLNLRILSDGVTREEVFDVSRMRCWRITTLQNGPERGSEESDDFSLELSFEYLIAKNQLQWITITSEQAILMSVCLQAMIDELLLKNVGSDKTREVSQKSWTYVMRDGQRVTMRSKSDDEPDESKKNHCIKEPSKSEPVMKKLVDRLSVVKIKKANNSKNNMNNRIQPRQTSEYDVMENNAFCMIGDDDL